MTLSASNQALLAFALGLLAVYFTLLVALSMYRYRRFHRVRGTELVTWCRKSSWRRSLLLLLGVASALVALLNLAVGRPLHHVYSQAIMALYFLVVVPLMNRLPVGLYRDGVWSESGFLPWAEVGRIAFREAPEIVLLLLRRGHATTPFRLPVPPDEYGPVPPGAPRENPSGNRESRGSDTRARRVLAERICVRNRE